MTAPGSKPAPSFALARPIPQGADIKSRDSGAWNDPCVGPLGRGWAGPHPLASLRLCRLSYDHKRRPQAGIGFNIGFRAVDHCQDGLP
jgi:hypothetical protein